jgi:hypothetical protein
MRRVYLFWNTCQWKVKVLLEAKTADEHYPSRTPVHNVIRRTPPTNRSSPQPEARNNLDDDHPRRPVSFNMHTASLYSELDLGRQAGRFRRAGPQDLTLVSGPFRLPFVPAFQRSFLFRLILASLKLYISLRVLYCSSTTGSLILHYTYKQI